MDYVTDHTGGLLVLTASGDLIPRDVFRRACAELEELDGMSGLCAHLLRAGNDPRGILDRPTREGYGKPAAVVAKLVRS